MPKHFGGNPHALSEAFGEENCPVCEGVGDVAADFGIDAPGRPAIQECPECNGTGRVAFPRQQLSTEDNDG